MSSTRDLHIWIGWFLIISNAAVGLWALIAHLLPRLRVVAMWWAVGLAQLSTFGAAIIGVILVNRHGAVLDQFHALYGFTTIVAVGIMYSYRTSPFINDKQYLLYGFGSLFIMGLGIRALYLNS